jgi:Cytochrome c554 and c-prime
VTSRDLDRRVLWLIACTALQLSCARSLSGTPTQEPSRSAKAIPNPDPPKASAVIFVSAEIRGYLGPCGCAQAMLGGIEKSAFQVRAARRSAAPVFYFDTGDALFGSTEIGQAEIPQQQRKAEAIAEVLQLMKVQTRAVGELDNARGVQFRESLGLPDQEDGTDRVFAAKGFQIAVVVARTEGELLNAARQARKKVDFVLALVHQSLERVQELATQPELEVDLLVAGHGEGVFASEENRLIRSRVPIVRLQSKGRSLARIDLYGFRSGSKFELLKTLSDAEHEMQTLDLRIQLLKREINVPAISDRLRTLKQAKLAELIMRRDQISASGTKPVSGTNAFSVRFIPLESTLPRDRESESIVEAYERDVGMLNLAWAQAHGQNCPPAKKGEAAFVGNDSCRTCHARAFPTWDGSKHAHAYWTLEERGKQYDLDCVKCHVTGPDRPGGVCRLDKMEGRKNVGCESCHGPGSLHVHKPAQGNIIPKPSKPECTSCHNPENSPHFDFALYLPQILGPGHGVRSLH